MFHLVFPEIANLEKTGDHVTHYKAKIFFNNSIFENHYLDDDQSFGVNSHLMASLGVES